LSGKYAEAFQFEDLHTNEVQQARLFIARLQSPDFPETPSNQVRDIVLHPGMTETQYIQAASDIIGDLQHQQFFQPSILGFWQSAKGPTIGSGTNLFMVIPCSLKPPRALRPSFEVMPAIWHDSKWKMWPME
jgi:hypothetical protein